jgi:hypothetical protein
MGFLSVEQAGLSLLCAAFLLAEYDLSWMKEEIYSHVVLGNDIPNKVKAESSFD